MKVRDNTYKVLSSVAYSNNPNKSRTIIYKNRTVKELDLHVELEKGKFHVDFYKQNQFRQADELAQEVKKVYPKATVSLTGHSLAGSMASYAAAKNDLHADTAIRKLRTKQLVVKSKVEDLTTWESGNANDALRSHFRRKE